jgi:ubiquinone/menaquinone biosynthesis C-methylase UbiE
LSTPFHDHFSAVAARYADFRPRYPSALFDWLASLLPRDSVVWDCACGNGQATCDLAARFQRVVATDASAEQIRAATPAPNIEYRVARAEASGLPDATVSLVTVAQAAHWFDASAFHSEVRRVLVRGGVVALWAYGLQEVEGESVNRQVHDYYSRTVGPYWPPERRLVEEGYRTLPFPFEEVTCPTFRMEAHWTLEQLLGYLGTWSATSRCLQATGSSPLPDLARRLSAEWGDPASPRRIAWPLALRVGRHH